MQNYREVIETTNKDRLDRLVNLVEETNEEVVDKALALQPQLCYSLFHYGNDTIEGAERLVSLLINGLFDDSNLYIANEAHTIRWLQAIYEKRGEEYKPHSTYYIVEDYELGDRNRLESEQVIEIMEVWTKYWDFYYKHRDAIEVQGGLRDKDKGKYKDWQALYPACVEVMEKYL